MRFLTNGDVSQTCILDKTDPCSSTLDPARISDTQITPDFYAADAAKRLRRIAVGMIGTPVSHVETIAGQSATCVDVPVPGGTSVFCVLAGGPLARLDDGVGEGRSHAVRPSRRRITVHHDRDSARLSGVDADERVVGVVHGAGPASVATTMSSRRIPQRPDR